MCRQASEQESGEQEKSRSLELFVGWLLLFGGLLRMGECLRAGLGENEWQEGTSGAGARLRQGSQDSAPLALHSLELFRRTLAVASEERRKRRTKKRRRRRTSSLGGILSSDSLPFL